MPEASPPPPPAAPLPSPRRAERPTIHLRVPGDRRHLFFFRKMVRKPERFIEAGALVNVVDRSGAAVGCGFYNPRSEVAVRMLGPAEEGLIEQRLRDAVEFRASLGIEATAYRVCHSEGDGLSGLIVDRYADVHSVELFSLGMFRQLDVVSRFFPNAYVHADERTQRLEGFRLPPQPAPRPVVVEEHGVRFSVDFERGHKTGFFCDQRENRRLVAELSRGKDLLDLCCYTGGFAVSAAKAGARRVVAVDLDEEALETAGENARLNRVKPEFLHQNLFDFLRNSREAFDVVVLDPPKLAREKSELGKARAGYFDMNRLAARVVKPGGVLVTCSCSGLVGEEEFLRIVRDASERELRTFRVTGAGPDHPVSSLYPEGRYLKVVYSRVV
ncbi:MAG: class I SAM-dependent rRNA methyltransferase [Planctomycetes bacterium]|nr:class I SAM-dependent rRNA methyltransferase [Planctomycetota bacterium]